MNQFYPVTMIARTTPGTHHPRIGAQTVKPRLREIGFFFGLVYTIHLTNLFCQLSSSHDNGQITAIYHSSMKQSASVVIAS